MATESKATVLQGPADAAVAASEPGHSLEGLSPLKLALLAERARAHSAPLLRADPIAIVGMGCRLPGGVQDPEAFWQLLRDGVDAVTEVPAGRWDAAALYDPDPSVPGRITSKWGGFLDAIDGFDAGFFGILPREAERMDPQQRVFLEVAIEALDHAGLPREKLAGSRTGAFVASYFNEYAQMQYADPDGIDARTLTGTLHSVLVNRLSYLLDLRGPSLSVDTACSSSLVAIHLACQSLRDGESDIALAGGISLMVSEAQMLSMSKVGFMAPDGRCKTFDQRADGFGRGEGCAIVVLKRLADAMADGERVLALIRGSAVNQDGHSTVLAAPNGLAQQALIREALANAQLPPSAIGYVEAHGTGTMLGDPIEVEALALTVGQPTAGAGPCLLGAAKANIGHLEAAAGAAGVIKSVLVLQHGQIPPQVHFTGLNPHISLAGTRLQVAGALTPWPGGGKPRCIGTSGFGVGGTNAHVVLQEAPRLAGDETPRFNAAPWMLPLSAQGDAALRELAHRWAAFLGTSQVPLPALCAAAGERRSHLDHRLAIVGESPAQMIERLRAFADSGVPAGVAQGQRPLSGARRIAFVFSGQGQQWFGMGRALAESEPAFREALQAVERSLRGHVPWSLLDELAAPEGRSRLDDTEVAQPAIFAIQVALAALWAHWGLRPHGVVGHSVGEIAALHVAGVLALDEAVRVVVQRARFMQRATGQGAMASVALDEAQARARLAPFAARLSLGAVNGPRSVVLSGEKAALHELLTQLQAEGVAQRALPVNYAFHSAQMQQHAQALVDALGLVQVQGAELPVYSTLTGAVLGHTGVDAAYFGRNVREPVRFAQAIDAMLADGFDTFVELAAHPVLAGALAEITEAHDTEVSVIPTLRRHRPERESLLTACAALYAGGWIPDWPALQGDHAHVHDLPAYPWQHVRYWLRPSANASLPKGSSPPAPWGTWADAAPAGGLLARRLPVAGMIVFETRWPDEAPAWLADHRVGGRLIMPGMAMLEALRQAASVALGEALVQVEDFIILRPLVLDEGADAAPTVWQVHAGEPDAIEGGRSSLTLYVADAQESQGRWQKVATASARAVAGEGEGEAEAERGAPPLADAPVTARYDAFAASGIEFGPAFRTMARLQLGAGHAQADLQRDDGSGAFAGCHPALLDGALQAGLCAASDGDGGGTRHLPLAVQSYVCRIPASASSPQALHAQVRGERGADGSVHLHVRLRGGDGVEVARLHGVRLAAAPADEDAPDDWLHEVIWSEDETVPAEPAAAAAGTQTAAGAQTTATTATTATAATAATAAAAAPGAWLLVLADGADTPAPVGTPGGPATLAHQLQAALRSAGRACFVTSAQAAAAALDQTGWRAGQALDGVAMLALATTDTRTQFQLEQALHLVQVLAGQAGAGVDGTSPQLCWLTLGAQGAAAAVAQPAGAALWGLGGVVAVEHPELALRLIDLDPDAPAHDAQALADELCRGRAGARRVAWREGRRWRPRLRQCMPATTRMPLRLMRGGDGTLDSLHWSAQQATDPRPGEVQVSVLASGLNFRDLLMALGMIPGQQDFLGAECAGIVRAVGPGVADLAVGDAVFGLAPGSLASFVNLPATHVARWPHELGSLEQAAALPAAFLTAMLGLERLAGLRQGQRVLIHAATGGVGLAAVQVAQRIGAEVFATAGSPAKRALLRELGVRHVFDSRSTAFTAQVLATTGGVGVDVVLNSLAGEFIGAGVDALAASGCFLELGKRDLWSRERFAAARPQARYEVYDLGAMATADPGLVRPLLAELLGALRDGSLRALPLRVFGHDQVAAAMRLMAQARHVGKLALRMPRTARTPAPEMPVRADASYVVTGGLGALGLHTARWLVARGARHLALIGRHAPDARALAAIGAMRAAGAAIGVHEADAADAGAMRALLERLDASGTPLRGIVHAAGRLDDGVLLQQSAARLAGVRRGKAEGALVLDALTRDRALDFFVLYSAAGLLLGPAGQGPYAAANAELDALAARRRCEGRPALSVAWGLWRDGGMGTAMAAGGHDTWSARGLRWITPEAGLARLRRLLRDGAVHAAVLPIDWARFIARLPEGLDPSFFGELGRQGRSAAAAPTGRTTDRATVRATPGPGTTEPGGPVAGWRALPAAQRREALLAHLAAQALQVLGLPATTPLVARTPLKEVGLDSLMAVELRNLLARSLGTPLPATLLFDHPSLEALVAFLGRRLDLLETDTARASPAATGRPDMPTKPVAANAERARAELAGMSDEEAEAQLLAELLGAPETRAPLNRPR